MRPTHPQSVRMAPGQGLSPELYSELSTFAVEFQKKFSSAFETHPKLKNLCAAALRRYFAPLPFAAFRYPN